MKPSRQENDKMDNGIVVVLVTCRKEDAKKIALHVVESYAAACVNIIPVVESVYRWEGELTEDTESLLVMKTTEEHFQTLSSAIREVHPYAVPEILAVPVDSGFEGYLRWVAQNTGLPDG